MADVRYSVQVDAAGAVTSIQKLDDSWKKLDTTHKETGKSAASFGDQLFSKLMPAMTAASLAADGIKKAIQFAKEEMERAVTAAAEAESVDRALAATLALVGHATDGTDKALQQYSKSLQRQTIFGDEAVKSAMTTIIQMRGTTDAVEQATEGAIGLARAFRMDLDSAARAVAQGFEGNYRQLGMLIPAIRNATTEGEKQSVMMVELGKLYNRAQTETGTYSGKVAQLKESYGELLEKLGDFVVKNAEVIKTLGDVKSIIDWMAEHVPENAKNIGLISDFLALFNKNLAMFNTALAGLHIVGMLAEEDLNNMEQAVGKNVPAARELWKTIVDNASAIKIFGFELGPTILKLDEMLKAAERKPTALDNLFKELGIKTVPQLRAELENAELALEAFNASGETAPGIISALEKKIADLKTQLYGVSQSLRTLNGDIDRNFFYWEGWGMNVAAAISNAMGSLGQIVGGELGKAIDFVEPKADGLFEGLVKETGRAESATERYIRTVKELGETMAKIQMYSSLVFGAMDAVFQQSQTNREIAIENEYKKRLEYINKSMMSEEEKQKAIEALEAEYQIKRTSAQRTAAKQSKAIAYMEAIVNTADAITKALTAGPFIGPILAGIIGAMGAIQIALIAKQPIPLAKGAAFEKPTLVQNALVGEAGPEYLLPEKKLRDIVRDAMTMPRFLGAPAIAGMVAGITRAFKDCMFPMSAAIAGFVDKLGVTQIATTAKQMIPLAQGAFFKKPTLLPAVMGSYAVAEAGAAEIVSPEPMMRRIVREESRGGPRITVNFNGPLIQTTGLSDADIRKAGAKLKRQLDYQLARVGG